MRLIQFFETTRLDELFLRHRPLEEVDDNVQVVAHRQNVWLFSYEEEGELEDEIYQMTGASGYEEARERPDIITGSFDGNTLWVDTSIETGMDPRVSTYIRKLAQFIGASNVTMSQRSGAELEDDEEVELYMHEIGKGAPDMAFHGTHTGALPDIVRFGLDPQRGTGNWESEVGRFEMNFLTVRYDTAMFHAKGSAEKNNQAPVIIQVRIPDKNQVGPDYDVALATGLDPELGDKLGFTGSQGWANQMQWSGHQQKEVMARSGQKIWQHSGIFSYRGRIPASFIVGIQADLSGEEGLFDPEEVYGAPMYDFGTDMEEFREAFALYRDHGYWYPDMEAELAELEDEEDEDY